MARFASWWQCDEECGGIAPRCSSAPYPNECKRPKVGRRPILRRLAALCLGIPTVAKLFSQQATVSAVGVASCNAALTLPPVKLHGFPNGVADPRPHGLACTSWQPAERRPYAVQFSRSLIREERQRIQCSCGLLLNAYVPKFTYVELVDEETVRQLARHPLVVSVLPLAPGHKIAPGLGQQQVRTARPDLLLRVVLFPEADPAPIRDELEQMGAGALKFLDGRDKSRQARFEVHVPSQRLIGTIAELSGVSWIEEVAEILPSGNVPAAWLRTGPRNTTPGSDRALRGQNQIIGVIDGGVLNLEHCWFRDDANNTPSPAHRKVVGYRDRARLGDSLHAAFVAGILVGDDAENPDAADRGIASAARITYGNSNDIAGMAAAETLLDYLQDAADDGARIHNCSWHHSAKPQYGQDAHEVDQFVWDNEECLVVGSSGNWGEKLGSPGTAKNALCVAAAYANGEASCLGDGAAGPSEDGRWKPDLLAPGCGIVSADAASVCETILDADMGAVTTPPPMTCAPETVFCAASFATPVVSAAAAIVRQYFVEGWYPSGAPTPADRRVPSGALLKATLLNAAARTRSGPAYPNAAEGWGLLQLDRLLCQGHGARRLWIADVRNTDGLFTGESTAHVVAVTAADEPLNVTLVWSEPPGQPQATDPVVNDLDLEVTSPDGRKTYLGNVFAHGESTTGGIPDDRNNVEMVLVEHPDPGPWTIAVRAREVNVGNTGQGYALVATAALTPPPQIG